MSDLTSAKGSCLFGSVTLTTSSMDTGMGACHCGMCRKWNGGPFLEVDCGQAVIIEGEEALAVYGSSGWAERGFCKNCGTHIFYRLKEPQRYKIPVGLSGDSITPAFEFQVFIDRKPNNYAFSNNTQEMTEAQIFEM